MSVPKRCGPTVDSPAGDRQPPQPELCLEKATVTDDRSALSVAPRATGDRDGKRRCPVPAAAHRDAYGAPDGRGVLTCRRPPRATLPGRLSAVPPGDLRPAAACLDSPPAAAGGRDGPP